MKYQTTLSLKVSFLIKRTMEDYDKTPFVGAVVIAKGTLIFCQNLQWKKYNCRSVAKKEREPFPSLFPFCREQ